jgi:hypothetical protein
MKQALAFLLALVVLSSCSAIQKSSKTEFTDGFYTQKGAAAKRVVFVDVDAEILRIHTTTLYQGQRIVDTAAVYQSYETEGRNTAAFTTAFTNKTFDVDFLTIPLKYRLARSGVPAQLNTNLNGAVFLGFRTDKYKVSYPASPLGKSDRNITHYGFSVGAFTGFGNTAMNATTTNNYLSTEYDGIVWTKGLAGIFALNNFTVGLALGFDNLLDRNRPSWIYENAPWFGLAFGLNLN